MLISLPLIIVLLLTHWYGDFFLQTDWMALNKSINNDALAAHVGVYTLILFLGIFLFRLGGDPSNILLFAIVNGVIHFDVDFLTSRWSSYLYKKGDRHNFFVVVGLDQTIHFLTLFITAYYIL